MKPVCRLLAVVFALATQLQALDTHAATRGSLTDIESQLLSDVAKAPTGGNWLGALPRTPETADAMLVFWRDLFADPAFIAATEQWLQGQQFDDKNVLYGKWMMEFNRIILAGVQHWTDEEIRGYLEGSLSQSILRNRELCIALITNPAAPPTQRMLAQAKLAPADILRMLATAKRTYLEALANKVPQPMPTGQQLDTAQLRLLVAVPEGDRETYLDLVGKLESPAPAQVCQFTAIHTQALLAVPGDPGRMLRRAYFVEVFRTALGQQMAGTPASVKGAASGQFQPGAATLNFPPLAARAGVEGSIKVGIGVDEQGLATSVRILEATFNKPSVNVDGKDIPSYQLFEPVTQVFYQSGRFMRRFENGKAVPYEASVEMDWMLDAHESRTKNASRRIEPTRTLVVSIPKEWESSIVKIDKGEVLRAKSAKASLVLAPLPRKTRDGKSPTRDQILELLKPEVARLQRICVEPDLKFVPTPAADGDGLEIFCTDKNHKPADPDDYKYVRFGFLLVDGHFTVFDYHSNEDLSTLREQSSAQLKSLRVYDTIVIAKP